MFIKHELIQCVFLLTPSVCHMLAEFLETVKKDFDKASKVFRSTCDDYGFAKSCFKYGNYSFLRRGKGGTPASATEALTYYEKGCKLDNSESCLHAGLLLMSKELKSRNIEQDFPRVNRQIGIDGGSRSSIKTFHIRKFQTNTSFSSSRAWIFSTKAVTWTTVPPVSISLACIYPASNDRKWKQIAHQP